MSLLLRSRDDELVAHATEIYNNRLDMLLTPIVNATNNVKR